MQFVNNEPEQIEIRRSRNTLIVVGTGTILFSIWTAVKMLGLLFMLRGETVAALRANFSDIEGISDNAAFLVITAVAIFFLALFMSVRVYVGMSAISDGQGKRRGWLYLVLAIFMIIGSAVTFFTGFFSFSAPEQYGAFTRNQSVSSLIIEVTSIIIMIQMVVSALKIRKLTDPENRTKD